MSGQWRIGVGAFLLFTGLTASPAFSNALTDLFNPAPKEEPAPAPAATPVPARETCLSQPGRSTARGQHWFYHVDGHRKCWYQAAEAAGSTKRQARHHFVKSHAIDDDEDETELRKKSIANARAQSPRPEPAETFRQAPAAPAPIDAAPIAAEPDTQRAPATPLAATVVVAERATDQVTSEQVTPRPAAVAMLLAEAPTGSDTVASVAPATGGANAEVTQDRWGDMTARIGVLLIVLGLVSLFGSLLASRLVNRRAGAFQRT
jgi:hypothetical protein